MRKNLKSRTRVVDKKAAKKQAAARSVVKPSIVQAGYRDELTEGYYTSISETEKSKCKRRTLWRAMSGKNGIIQPTSYCCSFSWTKERVRNKTRTSCHDKHRVKGMVGATLLRQATGHNLALFKVW